MKSIFKFSLLALAAAALFSCQKEVSINEPSEQGITRTFTCVIASPDTKVAVTDAGKTTWEVGDEILIHGAGSSNKVTVALTAADISADGKTATITVEGVEPYDRSDKGFTSTLYAQYPASLAGSGNYYYEARFTSSNDFLMAACNVENTFVFYNLCGIISFKVSGEFDNYEFVGNNGETVGYAPFQSRVWASAEGPDVLYYKPGNGCDPVAQKVISGSVSADGSTTHYVCIPACTEVDGEQLSTVLSNGFMFKFYDGTDLVMTAKTEKPLTIKPGQILALGDISSHLETYVPPTTSDHKSAITGATDLSSEMANCFVITAPGAYKFPALKGESSEAAGNVFDVELLWETYNNADEVAANSVIAAVDFEDNWIYFQTPGSLKPGNALIAAKNDQDKTIWSWHIWIPETAISTDTYGIFNHELMDRYLGALVAATTDNVPVESYGLTYQWGRKDPFVGAQAVDSGTSATIAGTEMTVAGGQITVAESIANPTMYGFGDWNCWMPEFDSSLWQDNSKTVYDPCPAGYMVPGRDTEQPFHSSDLSAVTGWSENEAAHYFTLGNPVSVFPFAGYRDDSSPAGIAYPGGRACIWTAHGSGATSAYHLNMRSASNGNAHKLSSTAAARGGSIRCVKIETASTPDPGQPEQPSMPTGVQITIDGNMSEWAAIPGGETPNNICKVFKAYNDADNFYFYVASAPGDRGSQLWGGSGYYYFDFDLDNNPATGDNTESSGNTDPWEAVMYLFLFGGSSESPAIEENPSGGGMGMSIDDIEAQGIVSDSLIEIELSVPRANLPAVTAGQAIRILSWRSKDGTKISLNYTVL